MRINDALIGLVLLVLAAAIFAYARTLPAIPGQEYGAAVFPMVIAVGLGGCGIFMAISGFRNWQGALTLSPWAGTHHAWARVATVFALVLLYVLAAPAVGFVPISIVILLVFMLTMGVRWWLAAIVAVATTLLIQQTFGGLLRVPLPLGLLGP